MKKRGAFRTQAFFFLFVSINAWWGKDTIEKKTTFSGTDHVKHELRLRYWMTLAGWLWPPLTFYRKLNRFRHLNPEFEFESERMMAVSHACFINLYQTIYMRMKIWCDQSINWWMYRCELMPSNVPKSNAPRFVTER